MCGILSTMETTQGDVLDEIRRSAAARDAIPELVLRAITEHKRQKDIAEAVGRTREWVRKLARAHGITPDDD